MSAPYGEGQPGTVFIYSGQNGSPIPVLSQTIVGSALNLEESLLNGLTSFGAFIEGNTDIDGNCHNGGHLACTVTVMQWKHILILSVDLVIGAFQSRKMFVLRYICVRWRMFRKCSQCQHCCCSRSASMSTLLLFNFLSSSVPQWNFSALKSFSRLQ